ncbi:MAG: RNA methyltransferase [Clostridia bacterium]|nr:RNA methyltransferase [Clostridia bacterium]
MMQAISSKDNQYLKLARSLQRKKGRVEHGCFLIEGARLGEEAAAAGLTIRLAFISAAAEPRARQVAEQLDAAGHPVYELPAHVLAGVSATETSQGIILIAELPAALPLPLGGHCYALLDAVADPGNVGAIIRSAAAAGVAGLILGPGCADAYSPKAVRAAMGGLFRLPLAVAASDEEAYTLARGLNIALYGSAMEGTDIRDLMPELRQPHLWLLGAEAAGLSAFWRQIADALISLPMAAGAESLNVAAAAAVFFYQSFLRK